MIVVCPFCGIEIHEALIDGLASCQNCHRVFESSIPNKLLSASWLARKNRYHGVEQLMSDTKLQEHEAMLVYSFVSEGGYSYQEFFSALAKLGIIK